MSRFSNDPRPRSLSEAILKTFWTIDQAQGLKADWYNSCKFILYFYTPIAMENLTIQAGTPFFSTVEGEQSIPSSTLTSLLKGVLEMGASFRFRANGVSMTPFIKQGDLVTLSPYSGSRPRRGDVAAFFFPGTEKLAIHRVVGKKENGYLLKGDNATAIDGVIPLENILARVKKVERGGREIRLGLRQERYVIALLARSGVLLSLFPPLCKIIRLFNR